MLGRVRGISNGAPDELGEDWRRQKAGTAICASHILETSAAM